MAEAAVIWRSHDTKGEEPVGFVILEEGVVYSEDFMNELRENVDQEAGDIAKPGQVFAVSDLPKTNSGEIMRRVLENIAEGEDLSDSSTLGDHPTAETIRERTRD